MTGIYAARTGPPRKLIWVREKCSINDAKNIAVFTNLYEYAARTGPPLRTSFLPRWTDFFAKIA